MENGVYWQPPVKKTLVFIAKSTPIIDGCNDWKTHPFTNDDSFFSSTPLTIYIFLAKRELTASDFGHFV